MQDKTFAEKINNIINQNFDEINELKRSYLIADEADNEEIRLKYENSVLKSLLNIELNMRKINSINQAALYQQRNDLIAERKENYKCSSLKQVR